MQSVINIAHLIVIIIAGFTCFAMAINVYAYKGYQSVEENHAEMVCFDHI